MTTRFNLISPRLMNLNELKRHIYYGCFYLITLNELFNSFAYLQLNINPGKISKCYHCDTSLDKLTRSL